MDLSKVDTIVNWPSLINIKDILSFLGFANFYRRFIYRYSRLAAPLTNLTRKETSFNQSDQYQDIFEKLKKAFTFKIILRYYNSDFKIVVETDALDYISGRILF